MEQENRGGYWVPYWVLVFFSSLLIIALGLLTFFQSRSSTVKQQNFLTHQAQETVDAYLSGLRREMQLLVNNNQIQELSYSSVSNSVDYYDVYQQIRDLKQLGIPDNMYLAYQGEGMILSNKASFPLESFWASGFADSGAAMDEFHGMLFPERQTGEWYHYIPGPDAANGKILLRQTIKFQGNGSDIAAFCVVPTESLLDMIGALSGSDRFAARILDSEGRILASRGGGGGKSFYSCSCVSGLGNWSYEILISKSDLYQSVWLSTGMALILVALGLVVYLFGAGFVFRTNQRRLVQIASSGQEAREQLARQIPYLRRDLFRKLLRETGESEEQLRSDAALAGFPLERKYYQVLVAEIDRSCDAACMQKLEQALSSPAVQLADEIHRRQLAVLCGADSPEEMAKQTEALCAAIEQSGTVRPDGAVGVGEAQENAANIALSYSQAWCALMNYSEYSQSRVQQYRQLRSRAAPYRFSAQVKNRLIQEICSGNLKEVHNIMNEMTVSNFVRQSLSEEGIRLLWLEFYEVLLRVQETLPVQDQQLAEEITCFNENFYKADSTLRIRDIRLLFQRIAGYAAGIRPEGRDELIYQIRNYVEENYRNPELSLQFLSEQFGVTDTYLSHLFKKVLNVNFSQYLEELRLCEACRLLSKSQLPISSIVEQVGYCSVNTFGKAFKRRYNISASQFRTESLQEKTSSPV